MPWGTRPPTGSFSGRDSGLAGAPVRAAAYRARVARFLPPIHRELERAVRDGGKKGFGARLRRAYDRMPSVSVDYGILEKEAGILVIPSAFGWNDIGTWRSLHEFLGAGEK